MRETFFIFFIFSYGQDFFRMMICFRFETLYLCINRCYCVISELLLFFSWSFASLNMNQYQDTPQQLASAVLKERGKERMRATLMPDVVGVLIFFFLSSWTDCSRFVVGQFVPRFDFSRSSLYLPFFFFPSHLRLQLLGATAWEYGPSRPCAPCLLF